MKQCDVTGKQSQYGRRISHSHRRTLHKWAPNLQKKTITTKIVTKSGEEIAKKVTIKVSAQGIRILKKQGLLPATGK